MKNEEIPFLVDSQAQFFFWEVDEAFPFALFVILGVLLGMMASSMALGIGMTYFYRKFKQSSLDGVLLHMGYWSGIYSLNKKFDNGLAREYEQ